MHNSFYNFILKSSMLSLLLFFKISNADMCFIIQKSSMLHLKLYMSVHLHTNKVSGKVTCSNSAQFEIDSFLKETHM